MYMFTDIINQFILFKLKINYFFNHILASHTIQYASEALHQFNFISNGIKIILLLLLITLFIRQTIKTKRSPLLNAHAQRNIMIQNDIGNIIEVHEWKKSEATYLSKVQYRGSQWSAKIDTHTKHDLFTAPQPGLYKIVGMEGNALLLIQYTP